MPTNPTARDAMRDFITKGKFTGLCNPSKLCSCLIGQIGECGRFNADKCVCAYPRQNRFDQGNTTVGIKPTR